MQKIKSLETRQVELLKAPAKVSLISNPVSDANWIKELFSYDPPVKEEKNGNLPDLENENPNQSHCLDAIRYFTHSHLSHLATELKGKLSF